jgi:KAP family P-loop domain
MTIHQPSTIQDINAALLERNPFAKPPVITDRDVWDKGFFDIENLNARASNAIFHVLDEIRNGHYESTAIVITAQDGTGKSHLIARIRHRLEAQGGALFVYANRYGELKHIRQGFQRTLASSLGHTGNQEVMQWQEIATAMANQAVKTVKPTTNPLRPLKLIKEFKSKSPERINEIINNLIKAFRQTKTISDADVVRAIYWTLSDAHAPDAVKWLGGDEISLFMANEMRLPCQRQSFDVVLQIFDLISEFNQLVICFDELDALEDVDPDSGKNRAQYVAGLIKELFENLRRGLILSVMMPGVWENKVKKLPSSTYSKVAIYGDPIQLDYMNPDSTIELATLRLQEFYKSQNLNPSTPCYPFTEEQLKSIGKNKPTIREFLKWCKEKVLELVHGGVEEDPVKEVFLHELEGDFSSYIDDNHAIADALFFGFQNLINQTVEGVTVYEVTDRVGKRGGKDDYLNFKIVGEEDGKKVCIGVAVLQYSGGQALGAGFRRLTDYGKFGLTRGCLVRSNSSDKKLNNHFLNKYLKPFLSNSLGGEFVELKESDIKPLLAIRSVYKKREIDYQLKEEQIIKFINEKTVELQLGVNNPLLREILSSPSYEIPDNLVEDESETLIENSAEDISGLPETSMLLDLVDDE